MKNDINRVAGGEKKRKQLAQRDEKQAGIAGRKQGDADFDA